MEYRVLSREELIRKLEDYGKIMNEHYLNQKIDVHTNILLSFDDEWFINNWETIDPNRYNIIGSQEGIDRLKERVKKFNLKW